MSGIGTYLLIAYLAVVLVFGVEITLIVVRRRNIERFIDDLGGCSEASDANLPGCRRNTRPDREADRSEVDPVRESSQGIAG